jgi:ketosteroid isomerase-like protein
MKHIPSVLAAVGAFGLLLLSAGCGDLSVAVTATGYVKDQASSYSRLICEKDFTAAAEFHHPDFVWHPQGGEKLSGQPAIDGFFASLQEISKMDTFYFYVHNVEKKGDKIIVLEVTMQAHTVENSMQMIYSNVIWKARMGWAKTDIASWQLANITEVSERVLGDSPPKDIKPL